VRSTRPLLFAVSTGLVAVLLAGGLAARVGAADNSFNTVVTFSEILSLVTENYVDPVDASALLSGAYEGMLTGLDPNGAYLTPAEVAEWKNPPALPAGPGFSVLKAGRALQVVSVEEGSPAEAKGVKIGDHVRAVDGHSIGDLSLAQAQRLLGGAAESTIRLELVHPADGFRREAVEFGRIASHGQAYRLETVRGNVVLRLLDLERLQAAELVEELGQARAHGAASLLIDVRNLADPRTRDVAPLAALFTGGTLLRLRERGGRLVETIESDAVESQAWPGSLAVLVNGATAGSAEALASLLQSERGVPILGEPTYGLGAEVKLYEMEDGSGLLVSAALWETASGKRWNGDGVQPDEIVRGRGDDYTAAAADQLQRALEVLERRTERAAEPADAA
jgi:carboxyl-terminal processing protease